MMTLEFTIEPLPPRNPSRDVDAVARPGRASATLIGERDSGPVTRVEPLHADGAGKTQVIARPLVSGELDDGDEVVLHTEPGRPVLRTVVG